MHAPEVQSQSVQLPVEGPPLVPVWQVPVLAHHPQVPRAVQVPQLVELLQGSAVLQLKLYQSQSPQLPVPGPVEVPYWQVPVLAHQPQFDTPVQAAQSACALQVAAHSPGEVSHSPEQLPEVGPAKLPSMQVLEPVHHPQPAIPSQLVQSVALEQPPTLHAPCSQAQSPQLPLLGPVELPSWQLPVLLHQPQPKCEVHSAQSP